MLAGINYDKNAPAGERKHTCVIEKNCYSSLRAIRKTALSALSAASNASVRRNAHEMALPTYIHAGRFSCETEKSPQECMSEL